MGGLMAVDVLAVFQSIWAARVLDQLSLGIYVWDLLVICGIHILAMARSRAYTSLWDKASIDELMQLCLGVVASTVGIFLYFYIARGYFSPEAAAVIGTSLMFVSGGFRFMYRVLRHLYRRRARNGSTGAKTRVLIVGAGDTGRMLLKDMAEGNTCDYIPVAMIDDDPRKKGMHLNGVRIVGGRQMIESAVEKYDADMIIVAVPSASRAEQGDILKICSRTGKKVRLVPGVIDLLTGKVEVGKLRDVRIEDLLGREPVKLDEEGIARMIDGSTVLVTGGAGSIGSEIVRQCLRFSPKRIIALDVNENKLYMLGEEIRMAGKADLLLTVMGSVRDSGRMQAVFGEHKPDIVFHAAAHKHVPLMEDSPAEAVKNNIKGTYNVIRASVESGVKRFILISTDKAVNPTSIMGATKRFTEMIMRMNPDKGATKFAAVRFGNVLGSDGSVIPIFLKQIEAGGPVTVTHKDITRYFMLISEAVLLVLQAASMTEGDELFMLDMGTPVRIDDMARDLIRLNGLEPDRDIKITYSGLRPGEKMYEELFYDPTSVDRTSHSKIFMTRNNPHMSPDVFNKMDRLLSLAEQEDGAAVAKELMEAVCFRDESRREGKPRPVRAKVAAPQSAAASCDASS